MHQEEERQQILQGEPSGESVQHPSSKDEHWTKVGWIVFAAIDDAPRMLILDAVNKQQRACRLHLPVEGAYPIGVHEDGWHATCGAWHERIVSWNDESFSWRSAACPSCIVCGLRSARSVPRCPCAAPSTCLDCSRQSKRCPRCGTPDAPSERVVGGEAPDRVRAWQSIRGWVPRVWDLESMPKHLFDGSHRWQITFKEPSGRGRCMQMGGDCGVTQFRFLVSILMDIPPTEHQLLYLGRVLQDGATFGESGVHKEATVWCRLLLRGD